jgi:hypothetical protein
MRRVCLIVLATCALANANLCIAAESLRDCDDLGLDAFGFPATTLLNRAECVKAGGQLCRGIAHAMRHRVTEQKVCYRGKSAIGGIRGTLKKTGP